ncbi:MAG: phage regulatory CII family protein, partial [Asticcacaulis sp.]
EEVGGLDEVTTVLPHRAKGWLYQSTNPDLEGRHQAKPTFEDVRALTRAGAMAFAADLARIAGMQLVPISGDGAGVNDITASSAALMREAGEALSEVAQAVADGQISSNERARMISAVSDVSQAALVLIRKLKKTGGEGHV